MNLLLVGKKIHASFTVTPHTAKVIAAVCNKYLVKMKKALNFGVEDMDRKHAPIDGKVMHQKALSLYEDCSKGSPVRSDTEPFAPRK